MKKHRKKQKKRVHMECHIFYYHVISVINMIIAIYFGNLEKARSNMMGKAKMFSISKQDALKIVQAMRMLKLLDEQFFNDIDGAERLMNDLTLFVIGKEDEK